LFLDRAPRSRIFQQLFVPVILLFNLRWCGWMTILCQQVANWAVDGLDYLLEKYVVVDVPLRGIGPQRFPFSMLQFVIARFSYHSLAD
jgi:hypothetical protein